MYSSEYERTGFQGGLQWYRCATRAAMHRELQRFAGRTIDVPSLFIAGAADWGIYQKPGEFERMQRERLHADARLPPGRGAGHWVQQEQPRGGQPPAARLPA